MKYILAGKKKKYKLYLGLKFRHVNTLCLHILKLKNQKYYWDLN